MAALRLCEPGQIDAERSQPGSRTSNEPAYWRATRLARTLNGSSLKFATTTTTGLAVTAHLDTDTYPTGIKISDQRMNELPLTRDTWHGEWNYTLHPTPDTPEPH